MKRKRFWLYTGCIAALVSIVSVYSVQLKDKRISGGRTSTVSMKTAARHTTSSHTQSLTIASPQNSWTTWPVALKKDQAYTVVAIGGSAADGTGDAVGEGGYLARAFRTVNATQDVNYHFINQSKVGYGPIQYDDTQLSPALLNDSQMERLFKDYKPNMLVISFGMLDDIDKKTPMGQIKQALHDEIESAINQHVVVVIVTPPSTYASETYYKAPLNAYVQAEMGVVEEFHNPNIYVIPLAQQMDQYIKSHHQTIKMYEADSWHPNAAGHALAGNLLAQDIIHKFLLANAKA
ncbi:SGNH/GDSL hydrolase family protein [Alicyclobacillus fastidiosus]|uniref:SGNH/GDSL hydrolase family protein n=1 Tax=Alicyclobacillus fastidiosus TaxID=392011 RepID=A0ABV5AJI2_9BACL|nr:SGNH/GDSL hydrolase family protein [Alicyclobacillus fastidiosus]WEH08276.1 SGNH/GDSL hydrolase family protein [Alicyclobacillus fastidiosus]